VQRGEFKCQKIEVADVAVSVSVEIAAG